MITRCCRSHESTPFGAKRLEMIDNRRILSWVLFMSTSLAVCSTRAADPLPKRTAEEVILTMLRNIQANGFNPHRAINQGLGGLWINWRTGSRPLATNWNGSGQPDGPQVDRPRHDVLTDLRFVKYPVFEGWGIYGRRGGFGGGWDTSWRDSPRSRLGQLVPLPTPLGKGDCRTAPCARSAWTPRPIRDEGRRSPETRASRSPSSAAP
jgi:hypothetical protein